VCTPHLVPIKIVSCTVFYETPNPHKSKTMMKNVASMQSPMKVLKMLGSPMKQKRSMNRLQRYLDRMLSSQGYPTTRRYSMDSALYCTKATAYDKGSFGDRVSEAVKRNDHEALRSMIYTGISPNPYNAATGEYLTHIVCREGDYKMLETMIELGGTDILLCVDQCGRTPLHNICRQDSDLDIWLDIASLIIHCDPSVLLMRDCNEYEPLKYVSGKHHNQWMRLLDNIKNTVWPLKIAKVNEVVAQTNDVSCGSESSLTSPFRSPSRVGSRKLPLEMASMLASGKMSEVEIGLFRHSSHSLSDVADFCQLEGTFKSDSETYLDEETCSHDEFIIVVDDRSDDESSVHTSDFAFDMKELINKIECNIL
jgi:hypothetical protein